MKTQIQFKQADGDNGIALIHGPVTTLEQAKRELADTLNLPFVAARDGNREDIDDRLRQGGVDPASITFDQVSE